MRNPNHKCASAICWSMPEPLPTVPAGLALTFPHTGVAAVQPRLDQVVISELRFK